jgi:hypothetical protein
VVCGIASCTARNIGHSSKQHGDEGRWLEWEKLREFRPKVQCKCEVYFVRRESGENATLVRERRRVLIPRDRGDSFGEFGRIRVWTWRRWCVPPRSMGSEFCEAGVTVSLAPLHREKVSLPVPFQRSISTVCSASSPGLPPSPKLGVGSESPALELARLPPIRLKRAIIQQIPATSTRLRTGGICGFLTEDPEAFPHP